MADYSASQKSPGQKVGLKFGFRGMRYMNINDLFEKRNDYYIRSSGVYMAALASLVVGLILLGVGFTVIPAPEAVWGAYLFNLFFFFCLGLGGMVMSAIQDCVSAVWARPIKRIWEGFGVFIPVATVMFILFLVAIKFHLLGADKVYKWIVDPEMLHHFWGKKFWLVEDFLLVRGLFILSLLTLVSMWQLKQSVARDMLFVKGDKEAALKLGKENKVKLNFWSGGLLVIYGVCLTFFGMDMIMSLSPLWFSTLFGGWQFAIMMQTLFATTLLVMFALKGTAIGEFIFRQQFHDVGKLLFGFTVFFGYTTFAHILTYWYGNMPEETEYYIHRLHFPWQYFLWFVFFAGFVFPMYSLVFKGAKWNWWAAIPIATIVLVAQWCTNLVLVMPEVVPTLSNAPAVTEIYSKLPIAELGGFLFFLGLFFTTFLTFARKVPMVGLADPLLPDGVELSHHHHG
jgi:hypothetical protein